MIKYVIILLGVLLIGCSTPQGIKVLTQEVKVPFPVSCVKFQDVPKRQEYVTVSIKKEDEPFMKVRKLRAKNLQLENYSVILEKIIEGCTE